MFSQRPKIIANPAQSKNANSSLLERLYTRQCAAHNNQPLHYQLACEDLNTFSLKPDRGSINPITKPTNSFIFVILADADGNPCLRIGNGSHFYLSSKAESVFAAGEITFKKGAVCNISDQSGCYHVDFSSEHCPFISKTDYLRYFTHTLAAVNLPTDCFKPVGFELPETNIYSRRKSDCSVQPVFFHIPKYYKKSDTRKKASIRSNSSPR